MAIQPRFPFVQVKIGNHAEQQAFPRAGAACDDDAFTGGHAQRKWTKPGAAKAFDPQPIVRNGQHGLQRIYFLGWGSFRHFGLY